jgi:hypothetical protein
MKNEIDYLSPKTNSIRQNQSNSNLNTSELQIEENKLVNISFVIIRLELDDFNQHLNLNQHNIYSLFKYNCESFFSLLEFNMILKL